VLLVTVVIGFSLLYTLHVFVLSRRPRAEPGEAPAGLRFVFMVPCLNEAAVIRATLDRLLEAFPGQASILVIDDGSDDATADIVEAEYAGRAWVLRRHLPDARRGKGMALNAGYNHLLDSDLLGGAPHDQVVVGVLDADGRVSAGTIEAVAPYFSDPQVGAVQIGVRMYNADHNILTRMQDMEFVIFTEVFQRGKQRIGSVGLGGNGQFTRLAALETLGRAPWTTCLTEDLDLGIRLLAGGWRHCYCPEAAVSQQAVPNLRRLIRQRSRWFQGHLQCFRLVTTIMRSTKLSVRASFDLVYHLTSPLLILLTSFVTVTFVAAVVRLTVFAPTAHERLIPTPLMLLVAYMLSFGFAPVFAWVYAQRDGGLTRRQALLFAHVYTPYSFMWFAAGWIGFARFVGHRGGWAKTAREVDAPAAASGSDAHGAEMGLGVLGVEPEVAGEIGPLGVDEPGEERAVGADGDRVAALDDVDGVPHPDRERQRAGVEEALAAWIRGIFLVELPPGRLEHDVVEALRVGFVPEDPADLPWVRIGSELADGADGDVQVEVAERGRGGDERGVGLGRGDRGAGGLVEDGDVVGDDLAGPHAVELIGPAAVD